MRRKRHPEHVNHERWLVSYADFITLLFAFFVVMWAISQTDNKKLQQVAASMKLAFGDHKGNGQASNANDPAGGTSTNPFDQSPSPASARMIDLPAAKTSVRTDIDPQLHEIRELLVDSIGMQMGTADAQQKIVLNFDKRGLVIRFAAKDFYGAGDVEIRDDYRPMIERLGRILSKTTRMVRVEGHTDPAESHNLAYPSDWELSAARAAWVAKAWIKRFELDPKRISVAGFSHSRPLVEKGVKGSAVSNRRVEIIILNEGYDTP